MQNCQQMHGSNFRAVDAGDEDGDGDSDGDWPGGSSPFRHSIRVPTSLPCIPLHGPNCTARTAQLLFPRRPVWGTGYCI